MNIAVITRSRRLRSDPEKTNGRYWIASPVLAYRLAMTLCATVFLFLYGHSSCLAFEAEERFADKVKERRVQELYQTVRCQVCEGQAIASSEAELAQAMRKLIRERVSEGKSNEEIIALLRERYGNDITLAPEVTAGTSLLWFGPFLFLLCGAGAIFHMLRQKSS